MMLWEGGISPSSEAMLVFKLFTDGSPRTVDRVYTMLAGALTLVQIRRALKELVLEKCIVERIDLSMKVNACTYRISPGFNQLGTKYRSTIFNIFEEMETT